MMDDGATNSLQHAPLAESSSGRPDWLDGAGFPGSTEGRKWGGGGEAGEWLVAGGELHALAKPVDPLLIHGLTLESEPGNVRARRVRLLLLPHERQKGAVVARGHCVQNLDDQALFLFLAGQVRCLWW